MNYTGKIIVLAYPDTFVTMSDEFICRLLPLVGLGTRDYIKAGHAALVLIENETGKAEYFDFGRYVTPKGHGRVRGANTDAEVSIPFTAKIANDDSLLNLEQILLWLDAHPSKTHGEGRLLASVCDFIDFDKAKRYIVNLQQQGSIPYGAFDKLGSNCARFVTDTILASTFETKIIRALQFNKKFTPSTVGNVEKAAAMGEIFEINQGVIRPFLGSAFKENITNYFDKKRSYAKLSIKNAIPKTAQKLTGIGSNAWFELFREEDLPTGHFRIKRYNDYHEVDFDGVYLSNEFEVNSSFQFTYDSHCQYCHVFQNNKKIKMECIATYEQFSLVQRVHSI